MLMHVPYLLKSNDTYDTTYSPHVHLNRNVWLFPSCWNTYYTNYTTQPLSHYTLVYEQYWRELLDCWLHYYTTCACIWCCTMICLESTTQLHDRELIKVKCLISPLNCMERCNYTTTWHIPRLPIYTWATVFENGI